MKYSVVIPAAGIGKRMNVGKNKVFLEVDNLPMIIKTMKIFDQMNCEKIVVVTSEDDYSFMSEIISKYQFKPNVELTLGGSERIDSVNNGLKSVESDYVLIHDGARPYLSEEALNRLLTTLKEVDGCLLAVKVKDTIKVVENGKVKSTPNRETLYQAQTPQAFKTNLIKKCYQQAMEINEDFTDDCSVAERFGNEITIVEGDYKNIKVTTIEDYKK